MLAGIKHHNTTATVLIVGLRDVVLLETKIGILNGEKGTKSWRQRETNSKVTSSWVGMTKAVPSMESTWFLDTFPYADPAQKRSRQQNAMHTRLSAN